MEAYLLTIIDPDTGSRIDTTEDELTEAQLDAFLANALEFKDHATFGKMWRFADGWYQYIEVC